MEQSRFRLIVNGGVLPGSQTNSINDDECRQDHEKLIQHYLLSKKLRNHSSSTLRGTEYCLRKFFDSVNKYVWQVKIEDVNNYHQVLVDSGLSVSTRRGYLNTISNYYKFLLAHPEIPLTPLEIKVAKTSQRVDWKYGVNLVQPVDPWFTPEHSTDDYAVDRTIPSKDELRDFFKFLRTHASEIRKPLQYHRDYAMFRLIYHTGIRLNECRMLDIVDISFERETVHVRFGKGSSGSGRRERYVPITLHGLKDVLSVYIKHYRPHFINADKSQALFLSEHGGRISIASIKRRLQEDINAAIENKVNVKYFTCHDLRRAFATHFYESKPNKIEVVRHMLGHSMLATTQRYLRPSVKFLEEQLNELTNGHLEMLIGDEDND
ncbi:tyrosine-type recombinase/integrase [Desulforamulus ruminis]|uniref:tyrosine-type recombinase/integrase n=1 Tax=Desulforamulus ruminis TaxID=1564 RepID=UPI00235768EE|nr:tyrosine-type recombinase/integrase [Desulforamulus ruminis]